YLVFAALFVANGHPPAAALALAQALDRMAQVQLEVVQAGEVSDHVAGQGAEVDVRTILYPGGGDGLIELALLHDQRHPFGDLLGGLAVLHIREQVVGAEQLMRLAQEGDILFTPDEALMGGGVDELGRRRQYLLLNQVGPELQGHVEVGIYRQRAVDSDAAIIGFGGVVQLTVTVVPSAGIVRAIRALVSNVIETFDNGNGYMRIQLFEQHSERGANAQTTDKQYVYIFYCH